MKLIWEMLLQTMVNIQKVIAELRSTYGVQSVGAEGFCWGGHYVVALLGATLCPHESSHSCGTGSRWPV